MTGPALFIYLLMYIICPYFVHSLIEFHFYAFYSSLSLKQAVVWRARMEKHNHGALWLIMDLHNLLLWSSERFVEIHHPHDEAPWYTYYMELHDWNVDGVS